MKDRKEIEQLENMEFREIINTTVLIFCFGIIYEVKGYMEIKSIIIPAFLLYLVIRFIILIILFCQKTDF